jgi:prepilin-type processing-associated H-X9-DG protein
MKCSNNLHQIGLAVHNHHDTFSKFPQGKGPAYPAPAAPYARWSVHSQLLPFIEQDNVYRMIDFNNPPDTPGMGGVVAFMPAYTSPGGVNTVPCRTKILGFICPSDGASLPGDWPGQNNYLANQGTSFLCDVSEAQPSTIAPAEQSNGPFYFLSQNTMASISDGLSNTVLFSEKIRGTGAPNPRTDMFIIPSTSATTAAATYAACTGTNPQTATPLTSKQGASWVMGEMCCTTYNHLAGPNTITCAATGFPGNMSNMAMQVPPSSRHAGGVNCLMGDGSVKFVRDSVDLPTWRAIGTMNGGEAVTLN